MAITIETIHSQLASALTMMASPAFTNMGLLEQRQTKDGMVANVVQSINHIEMMTLDDANALRPSIENALFSAEQQGRMMHAAMSSAMLGRARGMAHLATQTLLTPMEYLTQNDWITMQEAATLGAVEKGSRSSVSTKSGSTRQPRKRCKPSRRAWLARGGRTRFRLGTKPTRCASRSKVLFGGLH